MIGLHCLRRFGWDERRADCPGLPLEPPQVNVTKAAESIGITSDTVKVRRIVRGCSVLLPGLWGAVKETPLRLQTCAIALSNGHEPVRM